MLDDSLGDAAPQRILQEPAPGSPTCTRQVGDCDIAVGHHQVFAGNVESGAHLASPNRDFKLASPVLKSVDTIARTTISGWLSGRNCARQTTELPVPLALTAKTPV